MNVLIFITNTFPFGKGESFIENEFPLVCKYFDRVLIVPTNARDRSFCRAHSGGEILCFEKKRSIKDIPFFLAFAVRLLFQKAFYQELYDTIRITHNPAHFLKTVPRWIIYSVQTRKFSKKISGLIDKNDTLVLYSYWFSFHALIASELLKGDNRVKRRISRAHGFDLYFRDGKYPPLHSYLFHCLDYVLPCSIQGTHYLQNLYKKYAKKCIVSYLGTWDHGIQPYHKSDRIRIVSISNINEIKRLDRIIDALSKVSAPVIWTHYGDGELMSEIQQYAQEKLTASNITVEWKGRLANQDLMNDLLHTCYDLMVNVSDSEGLPVSLMEAMSFGLPCFATDVGGTSELVIDSENGYLVPPENAIDRLVSVLKQFSSIQNEIIAMREKTRSTWETKFSADKNYNSFIKQYLLEDAC